MPKVQPPYMDDKYYRRRQRSHCLTDDGRALLAAARKTYLDIAQPSVNEHEDGCVHMHWINMHPPARVLEAVFPPGATPDTQATVVCRSMRDSQAIAEHGQLTLDEMRPLVLQFTDHWNRNVWQPNGYRKQDGPYLITIQAADPTGDTEDTIWRVYRDNRIVKEGTGYSWQFTMHIAEAARNEVARREKHHQANTDRYEAALRSRPIHFRGEPKPDGKPATLCGETITGGKKRTRIDGKRGADAKAPGANVCAFCSTITQNRKTVA